MTAEIEHILIPRNRSFRADAEVLSRLIETFESNGWLAGEPENAKGKAIKLTDSWMKKQLSRPTMGVFWAVDFEPGGAEAVYSWPSESIMEGYVFGIRAAQDFFHLNAYTESIEQFDDEALSCDCGADLRFTVAREAMVRSACPKCESAFSAAGLKVNRRDPFLGEERPALEGGLLCHVYLTFQSYGGPDTEGELKPAVGRALREATGEDWESVVRE